MMSESELASRLKAAEQNTQQASVSRNKYFDSMIVSSGQVGGDASRIANQPSAASKSMPHLSTAANQSASQGLPPHLSAAADTFSSSGAAAAAGAGAHSQADLDRLQNNLRAVEASYLNEIEQLRIAVENVDSERLQAIEMYERCLNESEKMRNAVLTLETTNGKLRGEVIQLEDSVMVERRRREQLAFQFEKDIDFFTQREVRYNLTHESITRAGIVARWQAWMDVIAAEMRCERTLIARTVKLEQLNEFRLEQRMQEVALLEEQAKSNLKNVSAETVAKTELETQIKSLTQRLNEQRKIHERALSAARGEKDTVVEHVGEVYEEMQETLIDNLMLQEIVERSRLELMESRLISNFHADTRKKLDFLRVRQQKEKVVVLEKEHSEKMTVLEREKAAAEAEVKKSKEESAPSTPTSTTNAAGSDRELQLLRRLLMEAKEEAFTARKELDEFKAAHKDGDAPRGSSGRDSPAPKQQSATTAPSSAIDASVIASSVATALVEQLKPIKEQIEQSLVALQQQQQQRMGSPAPASEMAGMNFKSLAPPALTSITSGPLDDSVLMKDSFGNQAQATAMGQAASSRGGSGTCSATIVANEEPAPAPGVRVEPTPPLTPPPAISGITAIEEQTQSAKKRERGEGDAAILKTVFNHEISKISEVLQELRSAAHAGLTPTKQKKMEEVEGDVLQLKSAAAIQNLCEKVDEQSSKLDDVHNVVVVLQDTLTQTNDTTDHVNTSMAAIRHAMAKLLVSTTHNHKLLGDKMDAVHTAHEDLSASVLAMQCNPLSISSVAGGRGEATIAGEAEQQSGVAPLTGFNALQAGKSGSPRAPPSTTFINDPMKESTKVQLDSSASLAKRKSHAFDDSEDEDDEEAGSATTAAPSSRAAKTPFD